MSVGPLREMHLTTDLTAGVDLLVPAGEAWAGPAARLAALIGRAGTVAGLHAGDGRVFARLAQRPCVVLGHAFTNPAVRALYRRQYAFADDFYPGRGGFALRTVHNPGNCGHNVLLLAAADPGAAGAALDRLEQVLVGRGPRLPYTNLVESPLTPSLLPGLTPGEFRRRYQEAFEQNALRGPIEQGIDFGLVHHLTGDPVSAELFGAVLFYYHDLVRQRFGGEWCFEHMLFIYAWTWRLFYVWDLIEESDAFSDDDRQRMTDLLWGLAQYVAGLPYFAGDEPPLEIRQNHSTFAALSMTFAAGYFRDYYGVRDFEPQLARSRRIFDGQAGCYKPNDDGGGAGYCWIVPSHQLVHDLRRDDERFLEGGHLRQLADYAVLICDNLGSMVEFGDVGAYSARRRASRWLVDVLCQAASHYGEGGYLWALRWLGGEPLPGCYHRALPERPPLWLTGVCVAPLDGPLYEWARRHGSGPNARGGPDYPLVPPEKAFDKLSLRSGFGEDDFYLLLDGTSTYAHGHDDGNSIERLVWKGRMWLAETDYIWRRPRFHSSLVSICDGESHYPPPLVSLEWARRYPSAIATRTAMAPYNGVAWTRDLFWVEERFLLVVDTVELQRQADYDLRCLWRTLGDVSLEGSDLTVEQDGVFFRILGGDEGARSLADEEPRVAGQDPYAAYAHARGPIRILAESLSLRGAPGHRERFCNLMVAGTRAEVAAWRLERTGAARLRVRQGERVWLVGLDGAGGQGDGTPFVLAPDGLLAGGDPAAGAPSLSLADVAALRRALAAPAAYVPPARPPKRSVQPGAGPERGELRASCRTEGPVRCLAVAGEALACGTAGGAVDWIAPDGRLVWRVDTGAEVRAVCLARLDGEDCLLAGGRDNVLTCYDTAGRPRWQRPFGRSHGRDQCVNAIAVADLEGRGEASVLVATDGWLVWCLDGRGQERWQRQVEHHAARSLVVGDVDGDGRQEILVGTEYYNSNLLEADGRIRWQVRGGPGFNALALGDLDGDGAAECLYGSLDGNAYAVDSRAGAVRWTVNLGDEVRCGRLLEHGGAPAVVAGSDCGQVAMISPEGRVRWRADLDAAVCGLEIVGDQIACAAASGFLVLLTREGQLAGHRALGAPATCLARLGDGVVVGTADGRVTALGL